MADLVTYYVTAHGVFDEDQFNDLNDGRVVCKVVRVNVELVPEDVLENDELLRIIKQYSAGYIDKPLWIV